MRGAQHNPEPHASGRGGGVEDVTARIKLELAIADRLRALDVEQLRGVLALMALVSATRTIAAPDARRARW